MMLDLAYLHQEVDAMPVPNIPTGEAVEADLGAFVDASEEEPPPLAEILRISRERSLPERDLLLLVIYELRGLRSDLKAAQDRATTNMESFDCLQWNRTP